MSKLAHATFGAPGFKAEKADLDKLIQFEIRDAKNIQRQTGCSWSDALRLAYGGRKVVRIEGNAYCLFHGTLMAVPVNADGSIPAFSLDEWGQVENPDDPEQAAQALRALTAGGGNGS